MKKKIKWLGLGSSQHKTDPNVIGPNQGQPNNTPLTKKPNNALYDFLPDRRRWSSRAVAAPLHLLVRPLFFHINQNKMYLLAVACWPEAVAGMKNHCAGQRPLLQGAGKPPLTFPALTDSV